MEDDAKPIIKCPMCGCEEFADGIVRGEHYFKFREEGTGLLTKYPLWCGENTYAKRCKKCRFVAIFTENE